MKNLSGFKTVISMGIALVVALYQAYVEPLPAVDPQVWSIAVPAVALILRFFTSTPVFNKE